MDKHIRLAEVLVDSEGKPEWVIEEGDDGYQLWSQEELQQPGQNLSH